MRNLSPLQPRGAQRNGCRELLHAIMPIGQSLDSLALHGFKHLFAGSGVLETGYRIQIVEQERQIIELQDLCELENFESAGAIICVSFFNNAIISSESQTTANLENCTSTFSANLYQLFEQVGAFTLRRYFPLQHGKLDDDGFQ